MSTALATLPLKELSKDQIELIKKTVAKGASDDELKLFLHHCNKLQLDPFAKQVHFVKYGNAPGTVVIGIDGFRIIASRTGKHSGTRRGAIKDDGGKLIGAWAEVFRSDWTQPAREEVPFSEYVKPANPSWKNMPETMIKKVAEAAALRMAFPDQLSGVYSHDEMPEKDVYVEEKQKPRDVTPPPPQIEKPKPATQAARPAPLQSNELRELSEYVMPYGKRVVKGRKLKDCATEDLSDFLKWFEEEAVSPGPALINCATAVQNYLSLGDDDDIPF